jgi:hypothetical protein
MSIVKTPLLLRYIDGHNWELTAPFKVYSTTVSEWITVDAGFITDFNSIPNMHDLAYRDGKIRGKKITQKTADLIHYEFLIWKGAPKWKANTMYYALRAGGFVAWNRYRNETVDSAQKESGKPNV